MRNGNAKVNGANAAGRIKPVHGHRPIRGVAPV